MRGAWWCVCVCLLASCGDPSGTERQGAGQPLGPVQCPSEVEDGRAFIARIVSFEPGSGAGFGQDALPGIIAGPPMGTGEANGSLDVLSLGAEGELVVELGANVVDCEGPDFIIFENAFVLGDITYAELAEVSVSLDGIEWHVFDCDPGGEWPFEGCAGVLPVYSRAAENGLDPRDPLVSGGDAFDLADVGVERVRFVRLRDLKTSTGFSGPPSRGFDLDAIGIVSGHAE